MRCAAHSPGDTEAQLIAARGNPTHRYQSGGNQFLEYNLGPWVRETYMAKLGPDNKVISFEQVLGSEKFGSIAIDKSTKQDVLLAIGSPAERSYLPLPQLEVWSYPYKEHDVWNSVMHVHFDRNGIVRKMVNAPDLRFDPDPGMFGGIGR